MFSKFPKPAKSARSGKKSGARSPTAVAAAAPVNLPLESQMLVLEPRYVFDAALATDLQNWAREATYTHHDGAATHTDGTGVLAAAQAWAADAHRTTDTPAALDPALKALVIAHNRAPSDNEIAFIVSNLPDVDTLIKDIPAGTRVVLIDGSKDGMAQIAAYMSGKSGISAIQIISHGTIGEVDLGTAALNSATLSGQYAADIATIKAALAPNADIQLYGCDVAQGTAGHAFVQALATATGDNVAASTDLTGAATLGGNWVLEDQVGTSHTAAIDARDWHGTLATDVSNGKGAILSATGNSIYSIDIGTGKAKLVTTVPASVGGVALSGSINSVAVDQADGLIYYCDNSVASSNVALFAYDFVNNKHILIASDVTKFGLNVGYVGLGAAGATFANGTLFLAVDNPSGTPDAIYALSFANGGTSVSTARNLNVSLPVTNDWGDLGYDDVNNVLLSFNAIGLTVTRIDPTTGVTLGSATLPAGSGYQGSQDMAGDVFTLGASLMQIDPVTGAEIGTAVTVTTDGSTALGGSNDAGSWTPPTATVAGQVYLDVNSNTIKDATEPNFANVTVQLYTDINNNGVIDGKDSLIGTDTTDANGHYEFDGVLPGNYIVKVSDANGVLTGHTYTTAGGNINANADVPLIGAQVLNLDFGVNEAAPVLDLDSSSAGAGYVTTFTKLGAPVSIGKIGATAVTDTDSTDMVSASVVLTNAQTQDTLSIGTLPSGITGSIDTSVAGKITVTLTGSASKADYQSAIDAVTFSNPSVAPATVDRTIQATVNDGYKSSPIAAATIHMNVANIAPVEAVPSAQTTNANAVLPLMGLSVSDVDANGGLETVTLTVGHGTITLPAKTGLTFTTGDGTADTTMVFKGTLEDINAAIAGLTYTPTTNYVGADALNFTTNDNGNTGGAALSSGLKTVAITIVDVPPVAADDTFTTYQGSKVTIAALANDTDAAGLPLSITQVDGKAITAGGAAIALADGHGTVGLTAAGTLVYTPTAGFIGAETFAYTISDGHGGTDTANVTGTVTGPILDLNSTASIADLNRNNAVTFESRSAPVAIATGTSDAIAAIPATSFASLTVKPTSTFADGTHEFLNVAGVPFTIGTAKSVTGVIVPGTSEVVNIAYTGTLLTVTDVVGGPISHADMDTLVQGITYQDTAAAPNKTVARTFDLQVQQYADTNVSNIATATVNLTAGPVAVADTFVTAAGVPVTYSPLTNDSAPAQSPLAITAINGAVITDGTPVAVTGGTVTVNADNTVTFAPAAGYAGKPTFTYTITDGNGGTATATDTGTVYAPPVAANDTFATAAGTSVVIHPLANDTDPNTGFTLSVAAINGAPVTVG